VQQVASTLSAGEPLCWPGAHFRRFVPPCLTVDAVIQAGQTLAPKSLYYAFSGSTASQTTRRSLQSTSIHSPKIALKSHPPQQTSVFPFSAWVCEDPPAGGDEAACLKLTQRISGGCIRRKTEHLYWM